MEDFNVDDLKGFKRDELKKCMKCGKGVAHDQDLDFYRINLERFFIDYGAVQRAHGMEMMLGGGQGGAVLAAIMGPDPDLAKCLTEVSFLICGKCAMHPMTLAAIVESAVSERDEKEGSGEPAENA